MCIIYSLRSATDVCDEERILWNLLYLFTSRILNEDANSFYFLLSQFPPLTLLEPKQYEMERRQDPEGLSPGGRPRRLHLRRPAKKLEPLKGQPERHPCLISQADKGSYRGAEAETDAKQRWNRRSKQGKASSS